MVTDQEFDDAVVSTGLLMNQLFVESMWLHGIEVGLIEKIARDVVLKVEAEGKAAK